MNRKIWAASSYFSIFSRVTALLKRPSSWVGSIPRACSKAGQRLFEASEVVQGDTAVDKDIRIDGVEAEGGREGRKSLLVAVQIAQNEPFALPRVGAIGDERQEALHHLERFLEPLVVEEVVDQFFQRLDARDLRGTTAAVQVLVLLQLIFEAVLLPLFAIIIIKTVEIQFAHSRSGKTSQPMINQKGGEVKGLILRRVGRILTPYIFA